MPQPLIASLPLDLVLASGYVLRVNAIDPSTGAQVTGVRATDITYQVRPLSIGPGSETDGAAPMPLLVPSDGAG